MNLNKMSHFVLYVLYEQLHKVKINHGKTSRKHNIINKSKSHGYLVKTISQPKFKNSK